MKLSLLQSLFLGFLSGIAEILPVSAKAHRLLLLKMFGMEGEDPALRLMIHIAAAVALYLHCRRHLDRMFRAQRLARIPKKRRKRPLDTESLSDLSLLKTSVLPIIAAFLLYSRTSGLSRYPLVVAALLIVNGIILYIPQFLPGSNKSSGAMTRVDGLILGLSGAAATLPGISCIGSTVSIAGIRGMDLKKALNLALLMNIVLNIGFAAFDLIAMFGGAGSLSLGSLFSALLSGVMAFVGVTLGIRLLQKITDAVGYSVFGFYSWGAALLTFIFFLAAA